MHCVRNVCEDLFWIGGNDHRTTLFENIHPIPRGVSYNAYVLMDEKTVLFDTVDWSISRQFLENLQYVLQDRKLDYMIINHMEPDHGAAIEEILIRYPDVTIISTEKAFMLMRQFNFSIDGHEDVVDENDQRCFGKHTIAFVKAPMVHWPEAMVSFDTTNGVLFSADAFGSFGALDGRLFNDEVDFDREWLDDARRYYTNIVGKYGPHVQHLLKKAASLDISIICPLHGPVWRNNLGYLLNKYDKWSRYEPEEKGIVIAYASMYGNTETAVSVLAKKLVEKGMTNIHMYDVSSTHVSQLISETFKYSHMILASVTYNLGIYPVMHNFLMDMQALHVQKRVIGILENGSWACKAGDLMQTLLEDLKEMHILEERITLHSALHDDQEAMIDTFVDAFLETMQ